MRSGSKVPQPTTLGRPVTAAVEVQVGQQRQTSQHVRLTGQRCSTGASGSVNINRQKIGFGSSLARSVSQTRFRGQTESTRSNRVNSVNGSQRPVNNSQRYCSGSDFGLGSGMVQLDQIQVRVSGQQVNIGRTGQRWSTVGSNSVNARPGKV
ncbi:uncharacterized protein LOC110934896 [Helianthus annuus]|uniref:uncharacterized protein LOC110934896 n=1 Tax=Helianthus annuus TaxID=4232 RepID=UPI000B8EF6B8|nr:uncharacterized protein LOC110934896 [Helianthus annuus]